MNNRLETLFNRQVVQVLLGMRLGVLCANPPLTDQHSLRRAGRFMVRHPDHAERIQESEHAGDELGVAIFFYEREHHVA